MTRSRLVFLLLIAVAAGCVLAATPAQAKLTGAVWTTLPDGTAVDHNVYNAKEDVYLNGGPFHASGAWLPDGDYYFMVTDPPGKTLLSTDAPSAGDPYGDFHRRIHIQDGKVLQPSPVPPYTNHLFAADTKRPGNFTIQLMPYNNSKNGEYKMWVTPVEDYQPGNPASKFGYLPSDSKTDNFRVRRGRLIIFGHKFEDDNGNGIWDPGEPSLADWEIQLWMKVKNTFVYQSSSFTDSGDGSYVFQITQAGTYRIYEILKSGFTQTKPLSPNYYEINITKAMLTAGTAIGPKDFGNRETIVIGADISGLKWADVNGNGALDVGEPPLANWCVEIVAGQFDGGGNFVPDPSVTDLNDVLGPWIACTNENGIWEKADLRHGYVYRVCEQQQPGWTQTAPLDQSLGILAFAKDFQWYVTVPVGLNDDPTWHALDFGNIGCGHIIVYKFEDHDSNGIQDGIDEALSSWTMFLYDANPPNSLQFPKLLAWGATDSTGYIEFPQNPEVCLPFGTYIVAEMNGGVDWTCTTCTHGALAIDVTITPQDPVALVEFGNHYLPNH